MANNDQLNEVYYGRRFHPSVQRQLRDRVHWMCRQVVGKRVLDIGCSQGIVSILLGREGHEVVGVDVEPEAIEYATAELAKEHPSVQARVSFRCADAAALEDDVGPFDSVVIGQVLEHLVNPGRVLEKAWHLMSPGGRFIVTVPFGFLDHFDHKHTFYVGSFLRLILPFAEPVTVEVIGKRLCCVAVRRQHILDDLESVPISWVTVGEELLLALEQEHLALKRRVQQLEAQKSEECSHESVSEKSKQVKFLAKEVEGLKSEIERIRETLGALVTANAALQNQLQRDTVETYEARLQSQHDSLEVLSAQCRDLRDQCSEYRKFVQGVKTALSVETELEDLEALVVRVKELNEELSAARASLVEHEKRIQALAQWAYTAREAHEHNIRALRHSEAEFRRIHRQNERTILQLDRKLSMITQSTKFQLGSALVESVRRPLQSPRLLARTAKMAIQALRRKLLRQKRPLTYKPSVYIPAPPDPVQVIAWQDPPAEAGVELEPRKTSLASQISPQEPARSVGGAYVDSSVEDVDLNSPRAQLLLSGIIDAPLPLKKLRVAAIVDTFTHDAFAPECELITFRPDNWREVLAFTRPHLLFVESAWRGNDNSWQFLIGEYQYPTSSALAALVSWCRQHNIPTVFWNKEDPVHFKKFIKAAKLFDFVFTTDEGCVEKYKRELGHDRVFTLPFAAQPMLHNPTQVTGYRQHAVCFAGTYYGSRYPQRRKEMDMLLDAALPYGLTIYDRNYASGNPEFQFPERFRANIAGSLPYSQMVREYKRYKCFLNVNSVSDSETMFSRRVFELLASGTPVVSTESRGIRTLLGTDIVPIVTTQEEAEAQIRKILEDPNERDALALRGMRKVLVHHTYARRLYQVATTVGIRVAEPKLPTISVAALVTDRSDLDSVLQSYRRQAYADKELLAVVPPDMVKDFQHVVRDVPAASLVSLESNGEWTQLAAREARGEYVALMCPSDSYGPDFLTDLAVSTTYAHADVVGKRSYCQVMPTGGTRVVEPGEEFTYTDSVLPCTAMIRRELLADSRAGVSEALFRAWSRAGTRIYSIDRFNYSRSC